MAQPEHRNQIERFLGKGGLSFLRLTHMSGFSVMLSEYGAHVVSWTSPQESELLFTSQAATYEVGKPIRGGIPIIFPQFGKGVLPQHGLARTKVWKVVREQIGASDAVSVTLRLNSDEGTEKVWPHPFTVELEVVLTEVLLMSLRVVNTGRSAFSFTSALHNYLRIKDVSTLSIQGLRDVEYSDFLRDRKTFMETRDRVTISGPVDRAYRDSPETTVLESVPDKRRYLITKEGFSDTVVWNPWDVGAKAIVDMTPEEYRAMICVESGNILTPVVLEPGDIHSSAQILRVESM
jgi:glucose-6-phosphate 1-epimerase